MNGAMLLSVWKRFGRRLPGAGLLALSLCPVVVRGIGLRVPNQDAAAIARGNAFVATADNPSSLYYNPAGITQLPGVEVQLGVLNYLGINTHYEAPSGATADSKFEVLPIPQLYATYSPTNVPLSFGLGLYAPFGLGVEWPEGTGFRSLAIESRLQYLTVNPVVAWKITPQLSLAGGLTVNYSKLQLRRGLAAAGDMLNFEGSDYDLGFNAGLLWQPHPQWSFGANYRSATTMEFRGATRYDPGVIIPAAQTAARAHFPQIISAGISWRPTPKWNLEADVDWSDWRPVRTVTLAGTRNIFGFDLPLQLDWHDSLFYEFGITRYFEHGWFASAGYFYCTETATDKNFTPAIPDTALHVGSLGIGHKGERWRWALAGQLISGPVRTISNGQPNPFTGESANGKYQLFIPTVSLSLGCHF